MDQGPLVTEQIDAGAKLAREFDKRIPLQAAFWLKRSEDSYWLLVLASDQINDSNFDVAYGEVVRIFGRDPNIRRDVLQVRVRGTDDPIVKDVLDIQQRYSDKLPMHLRTGLVGGVSVDEVYIYPIPVPAAA
jgi:hypothetical protein